MSMSKIRIEAFDPDRHDYKEFDCGVDRLNNFLRMTAKKRQNQNMVRVFVAVFENENEVIGYFSTKTSHVDVGAVPASPKSLPDYANIPVLFLEHLAVSLSYQDRKIGTLLVQSVFEKAMNISKDTGCYAVALDVISDGSKKEIDARKRFYEKFGFASLIHKPEQMYLTISAIRNIIESAKKRERGEA